MGRGGTNKKMAITIGVLSAVGILFAMVKSNAWRRRAGLIYIDIVVSSVHRQRGREEEWANGHDAP